MEQIENKAKIEILPKNDGFKIYPVEWIDKVKLDIMQCMVPMKKDKNGIYKLK